MTRKSPARLRLAASAGLILAALALSPALAPALAQDRSDGPPGPRGGPDASSASPSGPHGGPRAAREHRRRYEPVRRGPPIKVPPGRMRRFHGIVVLRPHGHWYHGYGHYHRDADAYRWLAFTAITLVLLDRLDEAQQRALEDAQIRATTAPVGDSITWNQGGASGSVTALRDGVSSAGRYCREFQQTVTIGGKTEQAYGTACQEPDGTWEIVSTGP